MGTCNIDHSQEDVTKKLDSQRDFLSSDTADKISRFLTAPRPQAELNELFHLLKKYDLASEEEQTERNKKIDALIS